MRYKHYLEDYINIKHKTYANETDYLLILQVVIFMAAFWYLFVIETFVRSMCDRTCFTDSHLSTLNEYSSLKQKLTLPVWFCSVILFNIFTCKVVFLTYLRCLTFTAQPCCSSSNERLKSTYPHLTAVSLLAFFFLYIYTGMLGQTLPKIFSLNV